MQTKFEWDIVLKGVQQAFGANRIDEVAHGALVDYCHEQQALMDRPSRMRSVGYWVLGGLGTLATLGGVIALLATNWRSIPQQVQIVIGLIPLVVAWGVYFVAERRTWSVSPVWHELLSILFTGGLITAIAMTARILQLPSDHQTFFITLLILFAPLCYLLKTRLLAVVVSVLYVVAHTSFNRIGGEMPMGYWAVLGGGPLVYGAFYYHQLNRPIGSMAEQVIHCLLKAFLAVISLITLFYTVCYALDLDEPYQMLGVFGGIAGLFALSAWREKVGLFLLPPPMQAVYAVILIVPAFVMGTTEASTAHGSLFFVSLLLSAGLFAVKKPYQALLVLLAILPARLGGGYGELIIALGVTVALLVQSFRQKSLLQANGAFVIGALSLFLFFVSNNVNLTTQGILLIITGIGITSLNLLWSRLTQE